MVGEHGARTPRQDGTGEGRVAHVRDIQVRDIQVRDIQVRDIQVRDIRLASNERCGRSLRRVAPDAVTKLESPADPFDPGLLFSDGFVDAVLLQYPLGHFTNMALWQVACNIAEVGNRSGRVERVER